MTITTSTGLRRAVAAAGLAAVTVLSPLAAASAVAAPAHPAGNAAPSACRPANYVGKIGPAQVRGGDRYYRVSLTAARGYANCVLQGSPREVGFSLANNPTGAHATPMGFQGARVVFGPGHPVHFDIRASGVRGNVPATEVNFALGAPHGVIPGAGQVEGVMGLGDVMRVGPVQAGA